ncbi:MAG: exodeoxyribonuclease V subunit alpha [Chitinivibrionales bacterium]|nr:exodeoxyribonuclease V subunit alpha [Chitinivibrionales bacterium]MBD3356266.1 exodeoxyribonuclease V subunit alpha [Chitinivibrionales bacterium]
MKSHDAYAMLRLGRGRTPRRDRLTESSLWPDTPVELVIMLLLESGILSVVDMRRVHLLHSEGRLDKDTDSALMVFLVTMFIHLAEGNVRLHYRYGPILRGAVNKALAALRTRAETETESDAERFIRQFRKHESTIQSTLEELVDRFNTRRPLYPLVSNDADAPRPIVRIGDHYYFQRYYRAERDIIASTALRLDNTAVSYPEDILREIVHEVHVGRGLFRGDTPVTFHPRQQAAAALALLNRTSVISGGPGTGKTSVALQILRCHLRLWPDLTAEQIALTAPTGRAAARMHESIQSSLRGLERRLADANIDKKQHDNIIRDLSLGVIEGQTVHRLLRYSPSTATFHYNENRPLPHRLVVVDEVSMLDVALFSQLLAALRPATTLVLLGDRNQLPSVEAGAVLGDFTDAFYGADDASLTAKRRALLNRIIPDPLGPEIVYKSPHRLRDAMIVLTHSYRSVPALALVGAKINRADMSAVDDILAAEPVYPERNTWPAPLESAGDGPAHGHGCFPVKTSLDRQESPEAVVRSWIKRNYIEHAYAREFIEGRRARLYRAYDYRTTIEKCVSSLNSSDPSACAGVLEPEQAAYAREVFAYLEQACILCFVKQGPFGTQALNRLARNYVRPLFDPMGPYNYYHGMPLIITRNAHATRLYNGDIGVILKVNTAYYGMFRRGDAFRLLPIHRLPAFEPAFAMTVHKSQGSEFDTVLLVVPEGGGPLMTREILYTGLTRARLFAAVTASRESLEECMRRSIKRDSGIREFVDGTGI